jgi:hypothetical protein
LDTVTDDDATHQISLCRGFVIDDCSRIHDRLEVFLRENRLSLYRPVPWKAVVQKSYFDF